MSEKPHKSASQMDEELAAFTDRLLRNEPVEASGADQEEGTFEATLLQLKSVADTLPGEGAMQRIEKQLLNEWKKNQNLVGKKESEWQRFLPGSRPQNSRQWYVPAFAFAIILFVIILIVALPINQVFTSNIQATAGSAAQNPTLLFGAALLVVIGLVWLSRKKP